MCAVNGLRSERASALARRRSQMRVRGGHCVWHVSGTSFPDLHQLCRTQSIWHQHRPETRSGKPSNSTIDSGYGLSCTTSIEPSLCQLAHQQTCVAQQPAIVASRADQLDTERQSVNFEKRQ
jgi:hypothetical protein